MIEDHFLWYPYCQMATAPAALEVASAQGLYLTLHDGRRLMDGIASWWTQCHGHRHPHLVAAVNAQLHTLPHVMFAGLVHAPARQLAQRLSALLPDTLGPVFFCESGSVAVEIAVKMALQFWHNQGQQQRRKILSFHGGYHGDTFMAMALSDAQLGFHQRFRAPHDDVLHAPLPDDENHRQQLSHLLAQQGEQLAAAIVEPLVQGAGGFRFHSPQTLRDLHSLCRAHGVLIIHDEIMTGFGRTGTLFAAEQAQVAPDLLCLGKALSGGMTPLAATVASRAIFAGFLGEDQTLAFMHGPTFMGHALGCAAALASLDLFAHQAVLEKVRNLETSLTCGLAPCAEIAGVKEVRVRGAIGVVELTAPASGLQDFFVERGVWVRPFGNVIYLTPPFITSTDEAATLCAAVVAATKHWAKSTAAAQVTVL